MAKKKAAPASAEPASPKRLRRKLEKLEARQASASVKRDRAQARVDALVNPRRRGPRSPGRG